MTQGTEITSPVDAEARALLRYGTRVVQGHGFRVECQGQDLLWHADTSGLVVWRGVVMPTLSVKGVRIEEVEASAATKALLEQLR